MDKKLKNKEVEMRKVILFLNIGIWVVLGRNKAVLNQYEKEFMSFLNNKRILMMGEPFQVDSLLCLATDMHAEEIITGQINPIFSPIPPNELTPATRVVRMKVRLSGTSERRLKGIVKKASSIDSLWELVQKDSVFQWILSSKESFKKIGITIKQYNKKEWVLVLYFFKTWDDLVRDGYLWVEKLYEENKHNPKFIPGKLFVSVKQDAILKEIPMSCFIDEFNRAHSIELPEGLFAKEIEDVFNRYHVQRIKTLPFDKREGFTCYTIEFPDSVNIVELIHVLDSLPSILDVCPVEMIIKVEDLHPRRIDLKQGLKN